MRMKPAIAILLCLAAAGCAQSRGPFTLSDGQSIPASVLTDPPRDSAHPARNRQLVIPSGASLPQLGRPAEMNALFFLAAGEGPKPTMLLLHGLPGNERNLDLAQAVRRAGWNVLTFTYRGAWGSEGRFSIGNAIDDTAAAIAFLRSPEAVRTYGIDTSRIVVAGHSMGGYAGAHQVAAESLARHPRLAAVMNAGATAPLSPPTAATGAPPLAGLILLDAWDIAATAREVRAAGEQGRAGFIAAFDDVGHSLGPVTAADLADEVISRGEGWDLAATGVPLAWQPTLVVYAAHGEAAPNRALVQAIRLGCPISAEIRPGCNGLLTSVELDSDHAFADHRLALAAEVVRWLGAMER